MGPGAIYDRCVSREGCIVKKSVGGLRVGGMEPGASPGVRVQSRAAFQTSTPWPLSTVLVGPYNLGYHI